MSNKVERVNSTLELDEQIDLQIKAWKAQRVGWAFIFLIVLTAASGFYGEGWISKKEVKSGLVSIEYERFLVFWFYWIWSFFGLLVFYFLVFFGLFDDTNFGCIL